MNNEQIERHLIAASVLKTGNPWIDDALGGGLNKENFVLVAAKTGVGKTFFGVQLACAAAREQKIVHYFALEAEKHEIERRRLYYSVCRLIHKNYPNLQTPRYRDWLHMGYDNLWNNLESEALKEIEQNESTLNITYSTGVYTPEMFQQDVVDLIGSEQKPDLVILDHLHHFFLSGDEIDSLKVLIHQLKRIKEDLEVPLVVLAQLRKSDIGAKSKRSLPSLEDIRGTASLTDVATDVFIISRVPDEKIDELQQKINNPMYFYIAKSRTASETIRFAAIVGFDFNNGTYSNNYIVCNVLNHEDPALTDKLNIPSWAKRGIAPKISFVSPKFQGVGYE